jgi:hypothetical protein
MFYENIRGLVQLMRAQIYSLCRKYFLVYSFDILVLSLEGFYWSKKSFNTNLSINQQRCGLMKISSRILRVTHCQCQKKNKRLKPLL